MRGEFKYNDIINLPHYQSTTHPRMSNYGRAAHFYPFAALKGYEESIEEANRITNEKIKLNEQQIEELNEILMNLKEI